MLRRTVWSLSIVVLCALVADQASYGFSPNSDPSLVGLWKLDDGSGTTAVDSSTGGHHGTLMNGPVWVAGQLGGALEFDGTDDYVDTGLTQNLPTWTISVWANSPAAPSGSGLPSGPLHREQNYQINWNHNGGWAGCVGANLGGSWTSASLGTLGANTWYHLCGTYDGTAMKAYTNGELINTTTVPGTPSSETNSMKLGRHAAAAQYYRGLVDDARVYNRALTQEEIRKVMAGGGNPGLASAPDPEAQATDVPRDATLSWTAGAFAGTHDVYFGTRYEDVNTASRTADPAHVLVSQGQADATYDPAGLLEFGQTYAWRVDEVNAAPDGFIHKGDVWGFTVEPYAYPITPIAATASSRVSKTLMGPDQTINGSGMTGDQHGTTVTHMWVSSPSAPDPAWIQYEFDRVYKMHELWVWNSNQATEGTLVNYGAREVAVECSTDGATWTAVADVPEFAQATGRPDYTHNTTVNLDGLLARYVRLTMKSSWSGARPYSLSEVRFFQAPMRAFQPDPIHGGAGVGLDATLSWRPGREAVSHEVYIGTDPNTLSLAQTVAEHQVALASLGAGYGKTYYWRVDEVNEAAAVRSWTGDLWSLSTAEYEVVDDFESYNDRCNRVYYAWKGGTSNGANEDCGVQAYAGNGTGSAVGHDGEPYAEQSIVHSGRQSMPLDYDGASEATRTLDPAQDWTRGGLQTLSVRFYGAAANATTMPMWFQVTDQAGKAAQVTYGTGEGEDAVALAEPAWTEWTIPMIRLAGLDLTRVRSITIGFGPGTGSGQVFIDDIRLYPARDLTPPAPPVLAGHWKLDGNGQDSSGNGNHGTLTGGPAWVSAGRIGGALDLDGIDDYVDCGAGASLDITDQVTVCAWIRPDDVGNSEHNEFVAKGDTGYALKHQSNNRLEFFVYDGGWYSASLPVEPAAFNGQWHHVAGTYDGHQVKLYVDGVLVASLVHEGVIASAAYNVNIGRNSQETTRFYDGQIDDVRIYRGVLSRTEIGKLAAP